MSNKIRDIFSDKPSKGLADQTIDALEWCIKEKRCSVCAHFTARQEEEVGWLTGSGMYCDTGREPIETCEDYTFNPAVADALESLEIYKGENFQGG